MFREKLFLLFLLLSSKKDSSFWIKRKHCRSHNIHRNILYISWKAFSWKYNIIYDKEKEEMLRMFWFTSSYTYYICIYSYVFFTIWYCFYWYTTSTEIDIVSSFFSRYIYQMKVKVWTFVRVLTVCYRWFHIKVHSFNRDYLSIH